MSFRPKSVLNVLSVTRRHHSVIGLCLLGSAAPFLLFPTYLLCGTLIALLLVTIVFVMYRPVQQSSLHPPLLIFSAMIAVAILVSVDPDVTLSKSTGLLLGLGTFLVMQREIKSPTLFFRALLILLGLGLGFTFIGVFSTNWVPKVPLLIPLLKLLPTNVVILPENATGGVQANQLAATIVLFWPSLLTTLNISFQQHKVVKVLAVFFTAITTVILLLSQSRTGWIAALASVAVVVTAWVWLQLPVWRKAVAVVWIGLFLLSLITAILLGPERISQIVLDPVETTVVGNLSSLNFRLDTWRWSIEAIKSFPFTGTGLGTFRAVAPRFYPIQVPPTYDIAHAHNIFLQVALDVGLPGLIAYLALLMLVFWEGWQTARLDETLRPYALGLLGGLVALHIFGLTDALALGAKPGLLFWMNIGLLAAMRQVRQADDLAPSSETRPV